MLFLFINLKFVLFLESVHLGYIRKGMAHSHDTNCRSIGDI